MSLRAEATSKMLDRVNQRNDLLKLAEMSGGKLLIMDQYGYRETQSEVDQQKNNIRVDLGAGSVLNFPSKNIDSKNV